MYAYLDDKLLTQVTNVDFNIITRGSVQFVATSKRSKLCFNGSVEMKTGITVKTSYTPLLDIVVLLHVPQSSLSFQNSYSSNFSNQTSQNY